jgi:hypothetical protein
MTYDPRKVVSAGFPLDDFTFTYNISGAVDQTKLGNAVTLDSTAASTMKLAGDGAAVHGRLVSFEDRSQQGAGKTGAVQRKFKEKLPAAVGHGIAVGNSVCGSATAGLVRKAVAGTDPITNLVVEVGTDFVVVESL